MHKISYTLILAFALFSACSAGRKLAKENAGQLAQAETITADFFDRLSPKLPIGEPPELRFRAKSTEAVQYEAGRNMVLLTPYAELLENQAFYEAWSAELDEFPDGKSLYNTLLYNWMLPQRLSYLSRERIGIRDENPWDSEMQANLLSWLFLEEKDFYDLEREGLIRAMEVISEQTGEKLKREGIELIDLAENKVAIDSIDKYWYLQSTNFLTAYRIARATHLDKVLKAMERQAEK